VPERGHVPYGEQHTPSGQGGAAEFGLALDLHPPLGDVRPMSIGALLYGSNMDGLDAQVQMVERYLAPDPSSCVRVAATEIQITTS
jgi:hypothetical protein